MIIKSCTNSIIWKFLVVIQKILANFGRIFRFHLCVFFKQISKGNFRFLERWKDYAIVNCLPSQCSLLFSFGWKEYICHFLLMSFILYIFDIFLFFYFYRCIFKNGTCNILNLLFTHYLVGWRVWRTFSTRVNSFLS